MSQVYLAERRGSTTWGDRKSNQHNSNQLKCWFLVRGENRSTRGKTPRSRVENQKTQPTYDIRSGNRTRATMAEGQCSHHCTNTAHLITLKLIFVLRSAKLQTAFLIMTPIKEKKGRNIILHDASSVNIYYENLNFIILIKDFPQNHNLPGSVFSQHQTLFLDFYLST